MSWDPAAEPPTGHGQSQHIWWGDEYVLEVVIEQERGVVGCHVGSVRYPAYAGEPIKFVDP